MTTRERNLAVAVSAVLGVAVVGFLGYTVVLGPLLEKNRQITQKTNEINQLENDILDIQALKKKYEANRLQSLPNDPAQGVGVAREEYGRLLEGMCRRADLTGLKPSQIAMVGDNRHDLEMARAGGVGLAVGVLSGTGTEETLGRLADVVLGSVAELPDFLAR